MPTTLKRLNSWITDNFSRKSQKFLFQTEFSENLNLSILTDSKCANYRKIVRRKNLTQTI